MFQGIDLHLLEARAITQFSPEKIDLNFPSIFSQPVPSLSGSPYVFSLKYSDTLIMFQRFGFSEGGSKESTTRRMTVPGIPDPTRTTDKKPTYTYHF